jgi:phosphoribosyl-ATP pyrophosphohydrolase
VPELKRVIEDRKKNPKEGSYTCKLFDNEDKLLKKVVEEAAEVAIASKGEDKKAQAWEVADLIYHLMVLMEHLELPPEEVFKQLWERRK